MEYLYVPHKLLLLQFGRSHVSIKSITSAKSEKLKLGIPRKHDALLTFLLVVSEFSSTRNIQQVENTFNFSVWVRPSAKWKSYPETFQFTGPVFSLPRSSEAVDESIRKAFTADAFFRMPHSRCPKHAGGKRGGCSNGCFRSRQTGQRHGGRPRSGTVSGLSTPIRSPRTQPASGFRLVGRRERIAEHWGVWRDTVITERRSKVVGAD